jgi:hypothetical protein
VNATRWRAAGEIRIDAIAASASPFSMAGRIVSKRRAWMVQLTASSRQSARARSTLNPVSDPSGARKPNGGYSSSVMKRIVRSSDRSGFSIRRLGSMKCGMREAAPDGAVADLRRQRSGEAGQPGEREISDDDQIPYGQVEHPQLIVEA